MHSQDYQDRAKTYGFANEEELKRALHSNNAVVLDVRTDDEINAAGRFQSRRGTWVHKACTPSNTDDLEEASGELMPDKQAPVVVYCKSGRRASAAKEALKAQGYLNVLNAGGFDDLQDLSLNQ